MLRPLRRCHRILAGRGLADPGAARIARADPRLAHRRQQGLPEIPAHERDPLISEFRHAVLVGLSDIPRVAGPKSSTAQHPGRDLLEFCSGRQADVTRFCYDTRVWPTDNISERDLRPTKTQQKISGGLTSEDITQDRLDIRSNIDTARKNDINVMTVLRGGVSGSPAHGEPKQPLSHQLRQHLHCFHEPAQTRRSG